MSANDWRLQLKKASFNGVPFLVDSHDMKLGRRTVQHDYPLRDKAYIEDLGRRAEEFTIEAYVLGSDYMAQRDALREQLVKAGAGSLVHPYLGQRVVALTDASLRETTSEGGMARFTLTFVETDDNLEPDSKTDTAQKLTAAADTAITAIENDFAGVFSVTNQIQSVVDDATQAVTDTLSGLTNLVGDVTGPIAAAIRTPANMAAQLVGAVGKVSALVAQPADALRLYSTLFGAGASAKPVPLTTPSRIQQARNQEAIQRLTQRSAIVSASQYMASASFASSDEALAMLTSLGDAVDAQLEAVSVVDGRPIADDTYTALTDLRAALTRDLRTRAAALPRLVRYTPPVTLPALVISYQLYGDATRADEIVARNKIRHPLFVPGGVALEVLADA